MLCAFRHILDFDFNIPIVERQTADGVIEAAMVRRAIPADDIRFDPAHRHAGAEMPLNNTEQFFDFIQARAADTGEDADFAARTGKNKPPVAHDDTNDKDAVVEKGRDEPGDAKSTGNVLNNDQDPDHDQLAVKNHGTLHGEFGSLKLTANGKWVYRLDNQDPDTDALGDGQHAVDRFKYTVTDGHGGKDTATLKIKITGSDDAPLASIKLDAITADNVVNAAEAGSNVNITGTVGGDVRNGDTVTVTVNGKDFEGAVTSGHFSIAVDGALLSHDTGLEIKASVTTSDGAGHSTTASATKTYTVDITPPTATIALDAVTADNVVNIAEGAASTVAITGTVGGDVTDSDTVTLVVNGTTYTGTASGGHFSINVKSTDLLADSDKIIDASVTTADAAGNTRTAVDPHSYTVDITPPAVTIALDAVTTDNVVNIAEGAASTVAITGTVGGDVTDQDTITLIVNGTTYTGTASGGHFSINVKSTDLLADSDKITNASVTTTDGAGNTNTISDTQSYSVDNTAPTATIALDAVTADNVVNIAEGAATVAITGTVGGDVKDGDIVTLVVNETTYAGTASSGRFSISVSGADLLADGNKTIDASVTTADGAGNTQTATGTQTYSIDTTAPTATITLDAVTTDNVVNIAEGGSANVAITGTVGGDVTDQDTITLIVNGQTYTGTASGGHFSINVKTADLLADSDTIIDASVTVADGAGNSRTAVDPHSYTVDITPPSATIALDAVTTDNVVNIAEGAAANVAITGTVGGDVKDSDIITLVVNGTTYTGTASGGHFSINVTGADLLADGDKVINASVTTADSAGNSATINGTQTYSVDIAAPAATIALGAVTTDNIVNIAEGAAANVAITGTVGGDVKNGDTVTLVVNGHTYTGQVASNAFSINVSGADLLTDSDKVIDASVTTADGAGNSTTISDTQTYSVDTTAPTATIALGSVTTDNVVNIAEGAAANVAITGTVGGDVKNGDTVTLIVSGHTYTGMASGGHFSINVSGADLLADSDKIIDASVTTADGAGNATTVSNTQTYSVDTTAPTATIVLDAVTADNIVNISEGAASTVAITGIVGGDVKNGDTITLLVNGTTYTGTASGGHFSINVAGADLLADNDKIIDASVTTADGAGNVTTSTDTQTYSVDITAPTATIALGVVTTDNVVNIAEGAAANVAITGTVGGDVKNGDTVTLIVNGHTYTGLVASSAFSINVSGTDLLADSDKIIDASVTTADGAGNTTTADDTQSYSIDITPPSAAITLDTITANGIVERTESATDVAITGTVGGDVKDGDTVTLIVNGHTYTGLVASNAFSIDVHGADLLADSDKQIDASVTTADSAGNTTTAHDNRAYAIDLNLDMANLAASQGFIIQSHEFSDHAGRSVSSAGDVNGDGFDDLIVGTNYGGWDASGGAYVVFGTASGFGTADGSGRQVIDPATLTAAQGFIIKDDTLYDRGGYSVSSAGDVNGDGFDDLLVGAPSRGNGKTYVVFGTDSGFGTVDGSGRQVIDLATLTVDQGFILQGAGYSVSSAGDVNGDGFDDMIVGGGDGSPDASGPYVVFGAASGFGTAIGGRQVVDLTTLTAAQGFSIQGATTINGTGRSVSSAGDVNGDGFDDLIVGAPWGNDGGIHAGEAYVVFGAASGGGQMIDLATFSANQGFVIQGDTTVDQAGTSVSSAGDVNGDGFDDLIVGAPSRADGADPAGKAFVVFGSASGFGTTDVHGRQVVDLTTLSATQGFVIHGDAAYRYAGRSVSSAGDINGDGLDDLIVGAPYAGPAGKAYVVFGAASGFGTADIHDRQVIDLATLTAEQGFVIRGYDWPHLNNLANNAGVSVSSAGDVNGDGFDDLIVGASRAGDLNAGTGYAGEAYIVFGGAFTGNNPITTTGSAAAEMLIGGLGGDTLTGGGGADIIRSGAGDDVLGVTGTAFVRIDGGSGYDTLRIDGAGDVFDFATIRNTAIDSIEAVDMRASGSQEIDLAKHDIFHLSDDRAGGITRFTVHGDAFDTVSTSDSGWTDGGTVTIGADTYRIFDNGHAELLVDSDITLAGML